MNVPKDEPMHNLDGTDDDFDALLDASSLGAPHVRAVTDDIPDAARRRMALAARRQQRTLDDTASREEPPQPDQADLVIEADFDPLSTAQDTATDHHPASPALERRGFFVGCVGVGKSSFLAALAMIHPPSALHATTRLPGHSSAIAASGTSAIRCGEHGSPSRHTAVHRASPPRTQASASG
ncbi:MULTISPECIES: hypothetical protein [Streptomyces]|uniref:hypothetical protein n=1 Tax=Streptomyces TaxID=1883 RepID=UPI00287FBE30|nr:hypothetical protein [Streptomyces sp. CGMCC 4.1456]WNF67217.1 hypothetical protein RJD14_33685 [Streptomyces sp. CGMCC 4.1456]